MSIPTVPAELLEKYNRPGPRYTSYPTVPVWKGEFGDADYRMALTRLAGLAGDTLAIYAHMPFCAEMCHYCGCNSTVTRKEGVVDSYLDRMEKEVAIVAGILGRKGRMLLMHWGGGTPNFLNDEQLTRAYGLFADAFDIVPEAEVSIEIDPRLATPRQVAHIRSLGFNRISMGVQDFDPAVQEAIGRIQPESQTKAVYAACREAGFDSVNLDLVYGLPGQTAEKFARSIAEIVAMRPDRVALYSYAHLPRLKHNQKKIDESLLPEPEQKFALFHDAIGRFEAGGYRWVGMDHFALPEDELSLALDERRLHRNFMGYTVRPADHMLAFGNSGIGDLAGSFAQNEVKLGRYQDSLDEGLLPIQRGHELTEDDKLRRQVITHLICNLELPYDLTIAEFGKRVDEALPQSIERLRPYEADGFLRFDEKGLTVTPLGRFFIRNLCMELDFYLEGQREKPLFSKTV